MTRYLFIGEKPSKTAAAKGWRWEDGRLAAAVLFDALRAAGIDPADCRFLNLFGDDPAAREVARTDRLDELARAYVDGWQLVAMGKKVRAAMPFDHVAIMHPAARGAGRERSAYRRHVASVLEAAK